MKRMLIPLLALAAACTEQADLVSDAEALFRSNTCAACHSLDNRMVGPALKDIAEKNTGVDAAAVTLALHIKNGSAGVWGPIPMPPNPVSAEQATVLAEWILSLQ